MTLQEYNQEWENRLKASQAKYEEDIKALRAETEAAHAQAEALRAEKEALRAEKETLIEAAAVSLLSQDVGEEIVAESLRLPIERVRELSKRVWGSLGPLRRIDMTLQEYNQEWENRLKASQAKYEEDLKALRAEKEAAHAETEALRAEAKALRAETKAIRAENEAACPEKETLIEAAAVSLLSQGVGEETVSECLGLPIEEVTKLRKRS